MNELLWWWWWLCLWWWVVVVVGGGDSNRVSLFLNTSGMRLVLVMLMCYYFVNFQSINARIPIEIVHQEEVDLSFHLLFVRIKKTVKPYYFR